MKLKLHQSPPLEMCFSMALFFAKVKIFRFWPKTMDYSQAFCPKLSSFFMVLLLHTGRWYEAEIAPICSSRDVL